MDNNKTVRIFMMPQDFPCGPQSSCCGPIGQSEKGIGDLKSNIEEELGYEVEVIDVMNFDTIESHYLVAQLLSSTGPKALPIITLGDDIVSMGSSSPDAAVEAIREKIDQV